MTKTNQAKPADAGQVDCPVRPCAWKCSTCANTSDCEGATAGDNWCCSCGACGTMQPLYDQAALDDAVGLERESYGQLMAENVRLRALLHRALPMASALDATKTAVVWTVDLQCDASGLVRDIRAALGPNVF